MVTISREPIGYAEGWRYDITAFVPKNRAMKLIDKHIHTGHGHSSFGTYHEDVLHISLNDTDPKFVEHLAKVIEVCTDLENLTIGEVEKQIDELETEKMIMIKKSRGKYGK